MVNESSSSNSPPKKDTQDGSTTPKKRPHHTNSTTTTTTTTNTNNNNNNNNQYINLNAHGDHKRAVSSVQLAPSRLCKSDRKGAALVATASADGTAKIWDVQQALDHQLTLKETTETTERSSSSSRHILTASATCVGHSRGINEVCWNPVSPLLATASDDKTIRLWDAVTAEALVELRGHDNFVFCVDQHGESNLLVSGSFDETVKLWDIRTAQCVSTLPAHSDPVTAVSLSRDGTTVASASHDGLIRIWDVATGECLKTIYAAGNPPVSSITYSPNGKYLLAGTLDNCLRLWPVTLSGSNRCAKTYTTSKLPPDQNCHVNSKYSVVADFTYQGDIVTGSETGDVVIYNLQDRSVQQVLKGHTDTVLAVSAHDKLPIICTGAMTLDRKVEFWVQPQWLYNDEENDGDKNDKKRVTTQTKTTVTAAPVTSSSTTTMTASAAEPKSKKQR